MSSVQFACQTLLAKLTFGAGLASRTMTRRLPWSEYFRMGKLEALYCLHSADVKKGCGNGVLDWYGGWPGVGFKRRHCWPLTPHGGQGVLGFGSRATQILGLFALLWVHAAALLTKDRLITHASY